MFANCQMGGMDFAFPDVCLTPAPPSPIPVPIPYPNIAMGNMAVPSQFKVLIAGGPAHNLATTIPISNGDQAGLALGVISHLIMGPCRHVTGAFTVLIGGAPASRLTSMTMQNLINCPGSRIVPSQVKVLISAG